MHFFSFISGIINIKSQQQIRRKLYIYIYFIFNIKVSTKYNYNNIIKIFFLYIYKITYINYLKLLVVIIIK